MKSGEWCARKKSICARSAWSTENIPSNCSFCLARDRITAEHLCRNRPHGQKSAINTYLSKEPFAKGDDHRLFGDSVEMGDVVTSGTCQAALEQTNKPADSDIVLHQTARRKNNAVPSDCGLDRQDRRIDLKRIAKARIDATFEPIRPTDLPFVHQLVVLNDLREFQIVLAVEAMLSPECRAADREDFVMKQEIYQRLMLFYGLRTAVENSNVDLRVRQLGQAVDVRDSQIDLWKVVFKILESRH